jgi:sulfur-carrier protein adenylyltransferase/sulfurtransferase
VCRTRAAALLNLTLESYQKATDVQRESLILRLKEFGLLDENAYRGEAFSRNIGILTSYEQEQLKQARVAIAGLGGVGGVYLVTLARLGLGKFNIADFDRFEPANVNRQYGARIPDFGRHKLDVMIEEALHINPFLEIKAFPEGISSGDVDNFLDGVDVVLDGLDFFKFDTRRLLFNRSREKGIYVITAAPLGFGSAILVFSPHKEDMSFDEYFNIKDGMSAEERLLAFGIGVAPGGTHLKYMDSSFINLNAGTGPSVSVACQLCAAMSSMEALRLLLKRGRVKPVPYYHQFDPYARKYCAGRLFLGNRNPIQRAKIKYVKTFMLSKDSPFKVAVPEIPKATAMGTDVSGEAIRYILQAGIQAPSGDNAQPWKFSVNESRIFVHLDPLADSSFFNFRQMASVISSGAVLENMRIAATVFGLEGDIEHLPDSGNPECLARLDLRSTEGPKDSLHDAIWKRCTNRKLYDRKPIPQTLISDLSSQAASQSGCRLHLLTERSDIEQLARIIYRVDRIRTEHKGLHEHLQHMIHYNDEEALRQRDGFPIGNLEAGRIGEIFLRYTRPWPVMNFVNKIGLGRMVALRSCQSARASSAIALLTVPTNEPKDFLRGGQSLERVWLYLTQKGLSAQPMAAITLFWLRWKLEGSQGFSPRHQKLLTDVWKDYRGLFRTVDFEKEGQLMLFRLGYAHSIRHHTLRKSIDAFLV